MGLRTACCGRRTASPSSEATRRMIDMKDQKLSPHRRKENGRCPDQSPRRIAAPATSAAAIALSLALALSCSCAPTPCLAQREWADLCDARHLEPPYDRLRFLAVVEYSPFSPFDDDAASGFTPMAEPTSAPKTSRPTMAPVSKAPAHTQYPSPKPSTAMPATAGPTRKPYVLPAPRPVGFPTRRRTAFPTPEQTEWWEVNHDKGEALPNPALSPTLPPAASGSSGGIPQCPEDGYWFLYRIMMMDKWGDGWDQVTLKLTDVGQNPYLELGGLVDTGGAPKVVFQDTMVEKDGKFKRAYLCLRAWQCYQVEVGTSQWDAEVHWEIHKVDKVTAVTRNNTDLTVDRMAFGDAGVRCNFAISRTLSMENCAWTCHDRPPTPTSVPTTWPTSSPTVEPTPNPTTKPTANPTDRPTSRPTRKPLPYPIPPTISPMPTESHQPTGSLKPNTAKPKTTATISPKPTMKPTFEPTPKPTFDEKPREYPEAPEGYFSYDVLDPFYGPLNWERFYPHCRAHSDGDWLEFNRGGWVWSPWKPAQNSNSNNNNKNNNNNNSVKSAKQVEGYGGPQSPIRIVPERFEDDIYSTAVCEATHEIRSRAGGFSTCDPETGRFHITPTRLRLSFLETPPTANLPDGYGDLNAEYLDVTFPSLHTIKDANTGKVRRYDAEYTIFHPFPRAGKFVMVTILIDGSGTNNNGRFQDLLDNWAAVTTCDSRYDPYGEFDCTPYNNKNQCEKAKEEWESVNGRAWGTRRTKEALEVKVNESYEVEKQNAAAVADRGNVTTASDVQRGLRENNDGGKGRNLACQFNIYHRTLMPSAYFYSYVGTLPEPPCTPNTDWRVIDKPMRISRTQLAQIKSLLLNGVCKDDPYGKDLGDVRARPIQDSWSRPYWHCKRGDFPMDCERDNGYCDCQAILCPSDYN